MMIRRMILATALAFAALPAAAQSVKLTASEIVVLLTGNTAVGNWQGTPYRQYFDPDGSTIFAAKDARSALGEWRVDADTDAFQSLWPSDEGWEGWYVMEYDSVWFWVSKTTPPTPFKVLSGQQLVTE